MRPRSTSLVPAVTDPHPRSGPATNRGGRGWLALGLSCLVGGCGIRLTYVPGGAPTPQTAPPPAAAPEPPPAALAAPPPAAVPAPGEPTAATEPPHTTGNGIYVRFGAAVGGDNLVKVNLNDGNQKTLDAGAGALAALGLRVTPLWLKGTIGFGAGGELGWKGSHISASNGDVTLTRYPLLLLAHGMARVSDHAYVLVAGGIEKQLGVHMSGSGFGGGLDVPFTSRLGGTGEVALLYAETANLAFDFTLRLSRLTYEYQGQPFDANSVGFAIGGYFTL